MIRRRVSPSEGDAMWAAMVSGAMMMLMMKTKKQRKEQQVVFLVSVAASRYK